jgi:hypothetical protein
MLPVTRSLMQNLYENTNDKIRNGKIEEIIKMIYSRAINFAEKNPVKSFMFDFSIEQQFGNFYFKSLAAQANTQSTTEFAAIRKSDISDNIKEIIVSLETLFPECNITYKSISFARGRDGKEYDISTLDENLRQLIINPGQFRKSDCIVIDWS